MLEILESAYKEMQGREGRARKLSVLDMLIIMLGYYHDYRTMENIGFDYGVSKQRISEAISWIEQTLIKSEKFSLPSKRKLFRENTTVSIAIIDVTEQKTSYSGKKETHDKKPSSYKRQYKADYWHLLRKRVRS